MQIYVYDIKMIVPFEDVTLSLCGLISVIGVSNSGKTTLLRSILHKLLALGLFRVYVFSSTADLYRDTDYDFALPANVRKISMQQILQLKLKQEVIVKKSIKDKRIQPRWIAIILDDFIGDSQCNLSAKDAKVISQLAVSGRHYKICTIVLSQHLNKLPPVIRLQSNYIFVTKANMGTILEGIYPLQTQYDNKKQLWDLYNKHTKTRYASMLFQNNDPYADNVYWLAPSKMVSFIKDDISANILQELEEDDRDDCNTSNDQGTLSDDSCG
jgi:hypothetical protein